MKIKVVIILFLIFSSVLMKNNSLLCYAEDNTGRIEFKSDSDTIRELFENRDRITEFNNLQGGSLVGRLDMANGTYTPLRTFLPNSDSRLFIEIPEESSIGNLSWETIDGPLDIPPVNNGQLPIDRQNFTFDRQPDGSIVLNQAELDALRSSNNVQQNSETASLPSVSQPSGANQRGGQNQNRTSPPPQVTEQQQPEEFYFDNQNYYDIGGGVGGADAGGMGIGGGFGAF